MEAHKQLNYRVYRVLWIAINILMAASLVFALYAITWEYSTRRYLKGFSDAIVPANAPGGVKIDAILRWMQYGPTRLPYGASDPLPDRDPTDTLNYDALLRVCGTATNAFINLTSISDMRVRRLLLLDDNQQTKHVVAEVLLNGKWIIIDPAFRVVFIDAVGHNVTREDLMNPATFVAVTKQIPGYPLSYDFNHTAHIRMARFPMAGAALRVVLNHLLPGWEDSTEMTLLLERESLAAVMVALLLAVFLALARVLVRWFGENRLGVRPIRLREKIRIATGAFIHSSRLPTPD